MQADHCHHCQSIFFYLDYPFSWSGDLEDTAIIKIQISLPLVQFFTEINRISRPVKNCHSVEDVVFALELDTPSGYLLLHVKRHFVNKNLNEVFTLTICTDFEV